VLISKAMRQLFLIFAADLSRPSTQHHLEETGSAMSDDSQVIALQPL
jgi:hypothetical protein